MMLYLVDDHTLMRMYIDDFESAQNWIGDMFADHLSPIIDVNPSLGSSLHVDMGAERMYELHFHHQTQEARNGCKE